MHSIQKFDGALNMEGSARLRSEAVRLFSKEALGPNKATKFKRRNLCHVVQPSLTRMDVSLFFVS